MSWKEVAPRRFERPLDVTEMCLKNLCLPAAAVGRENWSVNAIATINWGNVSPQPSEINALLRRAWTWTPYHHPTIAVVLEDEKLTYQVPDDAGLAQWLVESTFLEDGTFDTFFARVRPRNYCSVHYFPATSELLLRVHHWLADGIGVLNLMHHFLQYLVTDAPSPSFGDKAARLNPGLTEVVGFHPLPTPAAQKAAQRLFQSFVDNLPSIGLPYETRSQSLGGTKRYTQQFDSSTLTSLIGACKVRGLSVTSAVHAAITVTTQEMKVDFAAATNYTSVATFNYRPYLPPPYNDVETWPVGCYLVGLPFSRPKADFTTHASAFQRLYHQPLSRAKFTHFELYGALTNMMGMAISQPLPPGMPLPSQPLLNSIGVMDQQVMATYSGKYSISVPRLDITTDVMAPGPVVYQWSWQGSFFVSVNYNDAFSHDEDIQYFLDRTLQILFAELGINSDC